LPTPGLTILKRSSCILLLLVCTTALSQTRSKDENRLLQALNELAAYAKPSLESEYEIPVTDSTFHILGDTLTYTVRIYTLMAAPDSLFIGRRRFTAGLNQINSVGHDLNLVLYTNDGTVNIYKQESGKEDWQYMGYDSLLFIGLVDDDDKKALALKKKIESVWKKASRWYRSNNK
jgi:hypothetical protein